MGKERGMVEASRAPIDGRSTAKIAILGPISPDFTPRINGWDEEKDNLLEP